MNTEPLTYIVPMACLIAAFAAGMSFGDRTCKARKRLAQIEDVMNGQEREWANNHRVDYQSFWHDLHTEIVLHKD